MLPHDENKKAHEIDSDSHSALISPVTSPASKPCACFLSYLTATGWTAGGGFLAGSAACAVCPGGSHQSGQQCCLRRNRCAFSSKCSAGRACCGIWHYHPSWLHCNTVTTQSVRGAYAHRQYWVMADPLLSLLPSLGVPVAFSLHERQLCCMMPHVVNCFTMSDVCSGLCITALSPATMLVRKAV